MLPNQMNMHFLSDDIDRGNECKFPSSIVNERHTIMHTQPKKKPTHTHTLFRGNFISVSICRDIFPVILKLVSYSYDLLFTKYEKFVTTYTGCVCTTKLELIDESRKNRLRAYSIHEEQHTLYQKSSHEYTI